MQGFIIMHKKFDKSVHKQLTKTIDHGGCIATLYGTFNYYPLVCDVSRAADSVYLEVMRNVSLNVCRQMCSVSFSVNCSGLFWLRQEGKCWLTSYTGDYDDDVTCANNASILPSIFFRRRRIPCEIKHFRVDDE
jgi:hypothetical protein